MTRSGLPIGYGFGVDAATSTIRASGTASRRTAPMAEGEHEMHARDLDAAHARIDGIERNLAELASSVKDFAAETRTAMHQLGDKITQSQQTDWRVVVAIGALVATMIAGGWALVTRNTESLALVLGERDMAHVAAIVSIEERMDRHEELPGHYEAMQRYARLEAQFEEVFRRLDDLQREQKEADGERDEMQTRFAEQTRDRFTLRDYLEHEAKK